MPDVPPTKTATRGAVTSLTSALEACISLLETMITLMKKEVDRMDSKDLWLGKDLGA
jgi:hypothetical protein